MAHYKGRLEVRIMQAKLTEMSPYSGKLDPFVTLKLGHERGKTPPQINGGREPYWNTLISLKHPRKFNTLRVRCYTQDVSGKELLGECNILIDECVREGEQDQWFKVSRGHRVIGQIYLEMTYKSNY